MSKAAIIQLVNSNTPSGIAAALGFICLIIVIALTLAIGVLTAITWLKQVRAGDSQARYYCKTKVLGIIIPLLVLVPIVITENRLAQSLTYNKLSTFYYQQSYPVVKVSQTLLKGTIKGRYVVYVDHGKSKQAFVASSNQLTVNRIGNHQTKYQVTIEKLKPTWRRYAKQVPRLKSYELSDPRLTINKYQAVNYKEVGS